MTNYREILRLHSAAFVAFDFNVYRYSLTRSSW